MFGVPIYLSEVLLEAEHLEVASRLGRAQDFYLNSPACGRVSPFASSLDDMVAELESDPRATSGIDIAIVGGGLGGVILAIGLIRQGINVKIYEAAPGFGEIGAGVACGPNSIKAMSLISPGILDAFKKHSTGNRSPDQASTYLEFRPVPSETSTSEHDACNNIPFKMNGELGQETFARLCVHRARFLSEMVKLVPDGTAVFNKSLLTIDESSLNQRDRVVLHFTDGTAATASAVIGCDGIRSVTRSHLYGDEVKPTYTGEYAYRALVPAVELEAAMGDYLTYNAQIWMGDGGYIVTYPVDHWQSINMVAVVCEPGTAWPQEKWIAPANTEDLLRDMQGWPKGLVKLMAKHSLKDKWALHDLAHDQPYYRGRICLLGDSCHATTPHLGAGAGQAMEDAYILSNLLGKVLRSEDIEKAFVAYDTVRRPRSQQVIENSRKSGYMIANRDPTVKDSSLFEVEENRLFRFVWDANLEHTLEKAVDLMAR